VRAAILSIGDELVLGQSTDTNSAWIASRLADHGVVCDEHRTVDDDRPAIVAAMRALLTGRDLLLVTGGLGPTADDLTRHALGDLLDPGADLLVDPDALATLEAWFAGRPGGMPPANRVQAMRPPSASLLVNPQGTAPGLRAESDGRLVVCMPGPPREMRPMFEGVVPAWLAGRGVEPVVTAVMPSVGLGESDAAARLGELMDRGRNPLVGTTASGGVVSARIRATGPDAARLVADAVAAVQERWHPYVFAAESVPLAEATGRRLERAGRRLVTGESCTGGLLGAMLTGVAGSSAWYRGGWVTYDNAMKQSELGVPAAILEAHGAVSAEVAMAMALGGLARGAADDALSLTGIAGPGGAVPGKPVGTVWIGHASRDGATVHVRARRFRFHGEREVVRQRAATMALAMLRLALDGHERWPPAPASVPLLWEDAAETRQADRRALATVATLRDRVAAGERLDQSPAPPAPPAPRAAAP
jgi:nicotinamide-nucleotide amidase